jgi:serine/threonine-protein kinase
MHRPVRDLQPRLRGARRLLVEPAIGAMIDEREDAIALEVEVDESRARRPSDRPSVSPPTSDVPPYEGEAEPELLAPGSLIADRFRVGRLLGRGGHGFVYEAEHVVLGYPVAIKVLHAAYGLDARRRARFRREALLGARLRHRNVVAIFDAGELDDGSPFLVMEHVDGIDLAGLIERTRLDPAATVEIGVQLLAAVTALSERGVIHRDIKPSNLMLQRAVDGYVEVKLLDFGISKAMRAELALKTLTADDCVLGTPQYMSPEQVRGEPLDVRADLYAVGAVLFECLTGTPPYDGETAGAVLARILTQPIPAVRSLRSETPPELAAVIDRAVKRDPADRWRSPAEMAEALRAAAQSLFLPRGADAWALLADPNGPSVLSTPPPAPASEPPPPPSERSTKTRRPSDAPIPPASRLARWIALGAAIPASLALAAATWAWSGDAGGDGGAIAQADAAEPDESRREPSSPPIARGVDVPEPAPIQPPPSHPRARPTDVSELERRALSAFLAGRDAEAVAAYLRATELAPARASAWRGLGLASAASGDERTATRALRRYLELSPRARDRRAIQQRLARLGR